MFNRILYAIILALASGLSGITWLYFHNEKQHALEIASYAALSESASEGRKQAQAALKASEGTVALLKRTNAATGLKMARAQEALQNALQGNTEWSNTNVPPDVRNALLQASEGLPEPSDSLNSGAITHSLPEPAP